MNKYILLFMAAFAVINLSSCTEDESDRPEKADVIHQIRFKNAEYIVASTGNKDQTVVNQLDGYLFKDSVLVKTYPNLTIDAEGKCKMDIIRGKDERIYFLANTAGLVDNVFEVNALKEAAFLRIATQKGNVPSPEAKLFLTGMLDVSGVTEAEPVISLVRGYARIDVTMDSAPIIELEQLEIKNLAPSSYVFAQVPVCSPDGENPVTLLKEFVPAITGNKEAICYLYEQPGGQEVTINVRIAGVKNKLKVYLPEAIRRNHIYNIQITKVGASLKAVVDVSEWEDGETTEATPDLTQRIRIDLENSELPADVRVSTTKDTVYIPYYDCEFKLALEADAEQEVRLSGAGNDGDLVVTPDTPTRADYIGNVFKVVKKSTSPVNSTIKYVFLDLRDKNLPDYFSDRIVMVIEQNPVTFSGSVVDAFHQSTTCRFDEYIDGEIGQAEIDGDTELTTDTEWIKIEPMVGEQKRYRILAGYRPNDPEADGRIQEGHLIISQTNRKTVMYPISRPNKGLPVMLVNGLYWCKFNLRGDARSFTDQIQINDPVAKVENLYEYLKTATDEEFMAVMGDAYKGTNRTGLKLMHTGTGTSSFAYRDYATTNGGARPNDSSPKVLCPPGYQVPLYTNYNQLLGERNTLFPDGEGEKSTSFVLSGVTHTVYRYKRKNIVYEGDTIPEMVFNKLEFSSNPPYAFFGTGCQMNNTNLDFTFLLFANAGSIYSQLCGEYFSTTNQDINHTRIVRCVKSPVSFIY